MHVSRIFQRRASETVNGLFFSSFNESDSVAYSLNGFGFFIGNGDTEFLLKLHDKLYSVKAIGTEIGGERCSFSYFVFVNSKFIDDDSFNTRCNF